MNFFQDENIKFFVKNVHWRFTLHFHKVILEIKERAYLRDDTIGITNRMNLGKGAVF